MGKSSCFVSGCRTGYSTETQKLKAAGKRSLGMFQAPDDDEILEKWKQVIPRADKVYSREYVVCELHFAEDDVIRFYETKMPDGTVHKIERGKYALKPTAVPTIFPNHPSHLKSILKKRKLPTSRCPPVNEIKDLDSELEENSSQDLPALQESLDHSYIHEQEFSFQILLKNLHYIIRPNHWWGITSTDQFVICAKWNAQYTSEKRVVIESDLSVKIFVKDMQIDDPDSRIIKCVDDISSLLQDVDSYVIFSGISDESMKRCLSYLQMRKSAEPQLSWAKKS